MKLFFAAAEAGWPPAMSMLFARIVVSRQPIPPGWRFDKSPGDWLDDAVAQGDPLGRLFAVATDFRGIGTKKDQPKAMATLRELADQGLASAAYILGSIYEAGAAGKVDLFEAFRWHLKAAEQGYIDAQRMVAAAYQRGLGTTQDSAKSEEWRKKADHARRVFLGVAD
jgi:TPR repeat protein